MQTYDISKPSVVNVIHEIVFVLCKEFVPSMIVFPEGQELMRIEKPRGVMFIIATKSTWLLSFSYMLMLMASSHLLALRGRSSRLCTHMEF